MTYPTFLRRAYLLLVATCATGCTVPNPNYHPPGVCLSSTECTAPKSVCNLETGACVQCTSSDSIACGGVTPVCGIENTCQGCTLHSECASNVCRPDGSCSDGRDVAYVAEGGSGAACTQAAPCPSLSAALGTGKPFIKLTGAIADNVVIDNKDVTILAGPGARLAGKTTAALIKINGTSQVSIFDLKLSGAGLIELPVEPEGAIFMPPGNTATLTIDSCIFSDNPIGINAQAGRVNVIGSIFTANDLGVSLSGGGTFNISQSTFSHNRGDGVNVRNYTGNVNIARTTLSYNRNGVSVTGGTLTLSRSMVSHNSLRGIIANTGTISFFIVNNFIVRNGDPQTPFLSGGILVFPAAANSKLEFNTIAENQTGNEFGIPSGIECRGKVITPNNIIFRNTGGTGNVQVSSDCNPGNSLLTAPDNPGFVSSTDYHLTVSSPSSIVNAVDCTGVEDFDGDSRPQGGKCDLGADEYRPGDM